MNHPLRALLAATTGALALTLATAAAHADPPPVPMGLVGTNICERLITPSGPTTPAGETFWSWVLDDRDQEFSLTFRSHTQFEFAPFLHRHRVAFPVLRSRTYRCSALSATEGELRFDGGIVMTFHSEPANDPRASVVVLEYRGQRFTLSRAFG
jgi:hypothetical protein